MSGDLLFFTIASDDSTNDKLARLVKAERAVNLGQIQLRLRPYNLAGSFRAQHFIDGSRRTSLRAISLK